MAVEPVFNGRSICGDNPVEFSMGRQEKLWLEVATAGTTVTTVEMKVGGVIPDWEDGLATWKVAEVDAEGILRQWLKEDIIWRFCFIKES